MESLISTGLPCLVFIHSVMLRLPQLRKIPAISCDLSNGVVCPHSTWAPWALLRSNEPGFGQPQQGLQPMCQAPMTHSISCPLSLSLLWLRASVGAEAQACRLPSLLSVYTALFLALGIHSLFALLSGLLSHSSSHQNRVRGHPASTYTFIVHFQTCLLQISQLSKVDY